MNLIAPRFTIANVADATGVSANTIRQWYKREVLTIGMTDMPAAGIGLARLFSGRTALTIAITGALMKMGTPPKIAALAAIEFAHTGDEDRSPGYLFPKGQTVLLVSDKGHELVNSDDDTKLSTIFRDGGGAVIALELNDLVDRVRTKLGLGRDPLEPVDAARAATPRRGRSGVSVK